MNNKPLKNTYHNHSESGFSLLEMIIAVTVFLIIMSAIYGLLRIGVISRNTINNRSETITNARSAVNSVGKDTTNAGLGFTRVGGIVPDDFARQWLNTPLDSNPERDLLTGIIAGNNISASDLSIGTQKNDVIAFASRDLYFNGGNAVTISDAPVLSIINNSIVLKTPTGACASCKPYDLYLIESKDGKQAVVMATAIPDTDTIVLGIDDPLDINQEVVNVSSNDRSILTKCITGNTTNCIDYNSGVTAKKVFWVSYSVEMDGTLVRTSYGNNTGGTASQQIQKSPLAYGVQNFQVRYLLQDGTVSDDPSNGNTTPLNMNNVVQVEIMVTVKANNDQGSVTNTQLINVTSTFSTRNLKYDVGS
jgi:prepilin-type N-terminal cleavage/methylation domain-containing protein